MQNSNQQQQIHTHAHAHEHTAFLKQNFFAVPEMNSIVPLQQRKTLSPVNQYQYGREQTMYLHSRQMMKPLIPYQTVHFFLLTP